MDSRNTVITTTTDDEVVPSSLVSIVPILRVASDIEAERPRVAYLCRFYAFEKSHRLDPDSNCRGVTQFKTSLLQLLERDNASTVARRVKKSDALEIESYYQHYYSQYIRALDKGDRAHLGKAYQNAGVLFEVLCAVNKSEKIEEVAPEDNASSVTRRVKKSDAREIESNYQHYYSQFIRALDKADWAHLGKAYQNAAVYFEVLCAVNKSEKVEEVAPEIIAAARDVEEKQN